MRHSPATWRAAPSYGSRLPPFRISAMRADILTANKRSRAPLFAANRPPVLLSTSIRKGKRLSARRAAATILLFTSDARARYSIHSASASPVIRDPSLGLPARFCPSRGAPRTTSRISRREVTSQCEESNCFALLENWLLRLQHLRERLHVATYQAAECRQPSRVKLPFRYRRNFGKDGPLNVIGPLWNSPGRYRTQPRAAAFLPATLFRRQYLDRSLRRRFGLRHGRRQRKGPNQRDGCTDQ